MRIGNGELTTRRSAAIVGFFVCLIRAAVLMNCS